MPTDSETGLALLAERVAACRLCPRLVAWREQAAADPPRRHRGEDYWARPVPGFGDPEARIVVVGLAPAAHGANRTGRPFTGDRSGEWLYAAMHRAGLANQPTSLHRGDGLRLRDAYVTAVVRCAPPANKPLPAERDRCLAFLDAGAAPARARPRPARARRVRLGRRPARAAGPRSCALRGPDRGSAMAPRSRSVPYVLLGSYHVSQQNTFTGRLTREMLDAVFDRARELTQGRDQVKGSV